LEHNICNDLANVSFNTKIHARLATHHNEGNKVNPLFLEELQRDNEWVEKDDKVVQRAHVEDNLTWDQVEAAAT
jgi:hypothetical protein